MSLLTGKKVWSWQLIDFKNSIVWATIGKLALTPGQELRIVVEDQTVNSLTLVPQLRGEATAS